MSLAWFSSLGSTGILVSRLCFGSLTIGPLQANLPLAEGARLLLKARELGLNFVDTADSYLTYPYIREAIRQGATDLVVASKSYDYTAEGMANSLEKALREVGRDYLDLFLLHEQENALTLAGHGEALEYLVRARERGLIRGLGVSMHTVAAVNAAITIPEIDVIHPLINKHGLGIQDGTLTEMLAAVAQVHQQGKGVYAMKPLGGGHLLQQAAEALNFVLELPWIDSVAVGMQSAAEVEFNIKLAKEGFVLPELQTTVARQPRKLLVQDWCSGCGRCVARCGSGALTMTATGVQVIEGKCIFCGYCAGVCPDFCLKVV